MVTVTAATPIKPLKLLCISLHTSELSSLADSYKHLSRCSIFYLFHTGVLTEILYTCMFYTVHPVCQFMRNRTRDDVGQAIVGKDRDSRATLSIKRHGSLLLHTELAASPRSPRRGRGFIPIITPLKGRYMGTLRLCMN